MNTNERTTERIHVRTNKRTQKERKKNEIKVGKEGKKPKMKRLVNDWVGVTMESTERY